MAPITTKRNEKNVESYARSIMVRLSAQKLVNFALYDEFAIVGK